MSKQSRDQMRSKYVEMLKAFLVENGEEILVVGSNEIAVPCVDNEGNDEYCVFKIQVPTGSRDGDPYDPYALAQEYSMKQAEKAEKAKADAEKKAKKIARDQRAREERAAAKAARATQN